VLEEVFAEEERVELNRQDGVTVRVDERV